MKDNSFLVPERVEKDELLDREDVDIDSAVESFNDLRRINYYLGGIGVYKKALFRILRNYPRDQALSILDVGTGSGDLSAEISHWCSKQQIDAAITGLDIQPRFLQLAQQRHTANGQLQLIASDALNMPFQDNSFDIVISNLVLHHFYDRAENLLNEMFRVARDAVVVNDLSRHSVPLLFFKIFSPLFVRSPVTRYDGEVSLRRAFSYSEIYRFLKNSSFSNYKLMRHWSFRFGLVLWKTKW